MKICAEKNQKQILFTECGYRSIDYTGAKPRDFDKKEAAVNQELQSRLLSVMFELWYNDWMAGGYI
ncbi:MAG: hypothetical protein P8M61_04115 [Crocinitomicaceae bacterium]|nr:hypothetical protein [Crocinitomicaceae bacterium]